MDTSLPPAPITGEPDEDDSDTHCQKCGEPLSEFDHCALCQPRYLV